MWDTAKGVDRQDDTDAAKPATPLSSDHDSHKRVRSRSTLSTGDRVHGPTNTRRKSAKAERSWKLPEDKSVRIALSTAAAKPQL